MNHIIIQKARSHKYIRREGAPGSYEYFYKRGFVKRESQVIVNKMNDLMKVFGQSDGMCGPASIRIALSAYGKSYTEKELAQLAKSTSSEGTTHGNMVITVRSQGIHTLTFQNMSKDHSLEILKNYVSQGDPVIVDWLATRDVQSDPATEHEPSVEREHYCVIKGIEGGNIRMIDPFEKGKEGMEINVPIDYFMDRWYTISERATRWFLVLNGEEK